MILIIHTVSSVLALIAGALIFLSPKGTAIHKKTGYLYAVSLVILLFTSFGLFSLFGNFGVYHVLTMVSLLTLAIALYFPLAGRNKNNWVEQHLIWMGYSYIGLIMAAGSHLFSVFPEWPDWLRMSIFWGLPYIVGSILIFKNRVNTAKKALENIGK
ncbi:MAG: putative membrane protein [Saprospiraceae bacterium]|jgi:uncharacterized membrane protein